MSLSKKEQVRRSLELRAAFMKGYEEGYKAAMPMDKFIEFLTTLMDQKTLDDIRKWSKEEFETRSKLQKEIKSLQYEVDDLTYENQQLRELVEEEIMEDE